ncbi:MAG: hypothetical protein DSO07_00230 [Thermoproteota archaeon]|jgi:hypothetical protein|uniref:Uncharacterized protein n=1 Tax=Candidatus Methanodesulfokora washburnensis TaxID=2478471 RepID=A0A3R9PYV9_9CREN|nr:hypothetical protein [Candidatus Methanodesulfokores washburnensis]RSN76677.1 hypothetical protein D6D85_03670 [Candidatus Methanodesulfokores washburnensis]TDA42265.1 MAG: hypothetical protein DSO07_00230 [Candidatus Korarchaeota archaeon]
MGEGWGKKLLRLLFSSEPIEKWQRAVERCTGSVKIIPGEIVWPPYATAGIEWINCPWCCNLIQIALPKYSDGYYYRVEDVLPGLHEKGWGETWRYYRCPYCGNWISVRFG